MEYVRAPISSKVSPERSSQTSISASTLDGGRETPSLPMISASEVVKSFYDEINRRNLPAVEGLRRQQEYKGTPFPFSKGCSFYRLELEVLNGTRQIVYGRDCVEPAIKHGESAVVITKGVTWLLERFPQLVKWL